MSWLPEGWLLPALSFIHNSAGSRFSDSGWSNLEALGIAQRGKSTLVRGASGRRLDRVDQITGLFERQIIRPVDTKSAT